MINEDTEERYKRLNKIFNEFLEKKLVLRMKNQFVYNGEIVVVDYPILLFNDIKLGKTMFNLKEFMSIIPQLDKGEKNDD